MCGIFGFISKSEPLDRANLKRATHTLKHRGPDASGFFISDSGHFAMGHQRLSIIDLSDAAAQPMTSMNNRYVMVFNGEIYNFRELKLEVERASGKCIASSGDSAVILEGFAQFGSSFVERLNGMFALAIYDKKKEKIWLFRDRVGIKPLYIYTNDEQFAFASELKAFRALSGVKLELSHEAIQAYLRLGYVPTPLSIWQQVRKMKQGTFCEISSDGKCHETRYWNPSLKFNTMTLKNEQNAISGLKELLHDSVSRRLISDVPIGTFLSGGIDSSLITALVVEQLGSKVNTFSIGFESKKYDESKYAEQVSKYLGTNHHTFRVKVNDLLENFSDYFDWFDEPFADSSAFPTHVVSVMARQHVTVALSGDGGDELALGYGSYQWARRLNNSLLYTSRYGLAQLMDWIGMPRYRRVAKVLRTPNRFEMYTHVFSQEQYLFSSNEIDELTDYTTRYALEEQESVNRELKPAERFAFQDFNYYLADDLLVKIDRASMAASLECRVPLLDHRVVEYLLNVSERLKLGGYGAKHILKSILYEYVPRKIFERPKWGFSVPLESWLRTDLAQDLAEGLEVVKAQTWSKAENIDRMYKAFLRGDSLLYNRMWQLLVLGKWLAQHENG